MKKAILILLLLQSLSAAAQIRISDFKQLYSDGSAAEAGTALSDPDGRLCAVLKLETRQSGWTFDAGLASIVDTRYEEGIIWLYVPASARKLTVSHKEYGVLREWSFPASLEPGRTYTMRLSYEHPRQTTTGTRPRSSAPKHTPRPVIISGQPRRDAPPIVIIPSKPAEKSFSHHFADMYVGFALSKEDGGRYVMNDDYKIGVSYTWIGNRVGPYLSVSTNFDGGFSAFGGAAVRLSNPKTASLDWQVYGGAGLMDGMFGFDVGTRFGWRSSHSLSHWDFGFGCQFSQGIIMPTVSVGFYIWGVPALVGIGLIACAI